MQSTRARYVSFDPQFQAMDVSGSVPALREDDADEFFFFVEVDEQVIDDRTQGGDVVLVGRIGAQRREACFDGFEAVLRTRVDAVDLREVNRLVFQRFEIELLGVDFTIELDIERGGGVDRLGGLLRTGVSAEQRDGEDHDDKKTDPCRTPSENSFDVHL